MANSDRVYPLIDNYIYIYHLQKFCVIPMYPESISDVINSSFNSTNFLSRSAPIFTYQNSGPRSIAMSFDLHRDMMEDVNLNVSNLKDGIKKDLMNMDYVDLLIRYLQACALPKYAIYKGGAKSVEPPQVAVRLGENIFIKGVISGGVTVTYNKPLLDDGRYAVVKVSFTVEETDPYDAPTVAQVGSFRGITSTFKNGIYKGKEDTWVYTLKDYKAETVPSVKDENNKWQGTVPGIGRNKAARLSTPNINPSYEPKYAPVSTGFGPYVSDGSQSGFLDEAFNYNHYNSNNSQVINNVDQIKQWPYIAG